MGNSNSSNNDQNNWMTVTPNDASMPMFELSLRSVVERRPIFPSKISFNNDCDWWYAGCVSTDSRGYVPKNHLAAVTSLESNEWYFGGLKRIEAEHYLQLPGNDNGSFLVRISESQSSEYSLSVREENTVKHDRIRTRYSRTDRTLKRLYISRQLSFVNIQQLVNHYLENQFGLCC
uniref:Tyrosine-protein kinase Src42A n=1 Tax=Schistosoma haematobium TaxID=6185 RepID=A0A094ZX80_SCHHA